MQTLAAFIENQNKTPIFGYIKMSKNGWRNGFFSAAAIHHQAALFKNANAYARTKTSIHDRCNITNR